MAVLGIDTSRYSPGRHVVYVQAVDSANQAGTPQAVYFTVAKVTAQQAAPQVSAPQVTAPSVRPLLRPASLSQPREGAIRERMPRAGMRQN